MEEDYPVLENQVEYDLYDEVTPILFPLLSPQAADDAYHDMNDGGAPAGGVALAFSALTVPVPRSAITITEKHMPNLYDLNSDWYCVSPSMQESIARNGIDENA